MDEDMILVILMITLHEKTHCLGYTHTHTHTLSNVGFLIGKNFDPNILQLFKKAAKAFN